MLLCDADIKETVRILFSEFIKPCSRRHCSSNRNYPAVIFCKFKQCAGKCLCVSHMDGLVALRKCFSRLKVEWLRPMEFLSKLLRRKVTFSLDRPDMNQNRAFHVLDIVKQPYHRPDVMAVQGAKISVAKLLEKYPGTRLCLKRLLP